MPSNMPAPRQWSIWSNAQSRGIEIADDGVGFAIDQAQGSGGLGFATMHERADAIGGVLDIRSASGAGSIVQVELPQ